MSTPASSAPTLTQRPPAKRKKSRKKLYIAIAIVVLVIAGFVMKAAAKGRDKVVKVTTEKAITKTITQLVSATGKIQPEVEVKMQPEVTGEITELPFREGAKVKKGDLVNIEFDMIGKYVNRIQSLSK